MKRELWRLIYVSDDKVHLHACRIIGYQGVSPMEYFDAAKKLPNYDQRKYETARWDLCRRDRMEASPPRYEFNAEARKAVRALLGPPPEDPEYASYWSKQIQQPGMTEPHVPDAEPVTKKPKPRKKPVKKG